MPQSAEELLKNSHLSITDTRMKILSIFLQSTQALSRADIERLLGENFDRVTVYRALHAFLEKGLIHSIPSLENSPLYALCKDECSEGKHFDNHAHFICEICGKTYCLDGVTIPNIKLPKGYVAVQRNLILNGVCSNCKSQ